MDLDINYKIEDDLVKNYSKLAKEELALLSEEITKRLAKDAALICAARSEVGAKEEVTQVDVRDAAQAFRKKTENKKTKLYNGLQLALTGTSLIPGFSFMISQTVGIIITIILLPVIAGILVYLIFK